MRENICKSYIFQGFSVQNIKRTLLNRDLKDNPVLKIHKRFEQTLLQKSYTNDQQAREKMTIIISHEENANKDLSVVPLHTKQMAII